MSLLYVTLALGELYAGKPSEEDRPASSEVDKAKGAKYFRAGQVLIDAMDCHDITSLQTILCMVIYFQSLGLMHCCYSYISVAIASAFRMGLHRSLVLRFFDPIEQEVRKRAFWVLQTMDTYVATMLGLPKNIRAEDFDQDLPIDIDDEFITADGIIPMPDGHTSIMAVANAHTKLLLIMANVVARIYPNQKQLSRECSSYQVDYTRVVNVEAELEDWFRNVAEPPTVAVPVSPKALGLQLLLRLAYAHVQMVLYRPFIQHLVRAKSDEVPEMRSYACASACVTASMQVIWIVEQMDTHGLLIGAYWFTVYITFFAVMSLCMFILGNAGDPTASEAMAAAVKGRAILFRLSSESASAARCVASLGNIFDKISSAHLTTPPMMNGNQDMDLYTAAMTPPSLPMASAGPQLGSEVGLGMGMGLSAPQIPTFDQSMHSPLTLMTDAPLSASGSTMPLAAHDGGFEGETNSFPVFPPAWLDQAWALQTPESDQMSQTPF